MAIAETDPIDFLLDQDWDLVFEQGDFVFTSGVDGAVQDLKIDLQMVKGEWPLDRNEGLPYFENDVVSEREAILGEKFDERKTRAAIREVVDANELVDAIGPIGVEFDSATRKTSASFEVDTIFGETAVVEVETP